MVDKRAPRQDTRQLVRIVRGIQRNERLTLEDMALQLGISTSMLGMVYSGQRRPGPKFLRGVLRAYPHLHREVREFLTHGSAPADSDRGAVQNSGPPD